MRVFFSFEDMNKYLKDWAKDGETVLCNERGYKIFVKKAKEVKK